jgi:putrescine transport system substrate-binding protein
MKKSVWLFCLVLGAIATFCPAYAKDKIRIYNWANYIPQSVISEFTSQTGIEVIYDVYDSDEMLDAKLVSGNTGYDLVFPASGMFLANQIHMGLYKRIDTSKLKNYSSIDSKLLKILRDSDPDNDYTIPFMWTATGVGYNINKIKEIDPDASINSLKFVFDAKNVEKFSRCGVAWFNFPTELIALAILYNGYDPNMLDDNTLNFAARTLRSTRKFVQIPASEGYSDNLANGSVCLAVGWLGEIMTAKDKLKSAGLPDHIGYAYPVEGTIVSVDVMAIPATSAGSDNVYKFIDFLLSPRVSAIISERVKYVSANVNTANFISPGVVKDLSRNIGGKHFSLKTQPTGILRKRSKIWNKVLVGSN